MKGSLPFSRLLTGAFITLCTTTGAWAQVALGTSPYVQNFDGIGSGLPAGFTVRTAASATALGTEATLATAATAWNSTTGGFRNYASLTGLAPTATTAEQAASTNRALGVRQTGSLGDPGAAFVFQAANTTGKTDFQLSFKLQSLDASSPRVTTWQVDYGTGATPTTFTTVGSSATTGNSTIAGNEVTVSFGNQLDNLTGPVWIRITTLTASTGSGNRPTSAIDDFSLSWNSPAPSDPTLTVTPGSLAFGNQNVNTNSASQSYVLSGANLTGPTTVTAPASFTVSKDNTTFASTLNYTAAELATAKTVFVRFRPTTVASVSGTITNATAGATTRNVTVTGNGVDPNLITASFDNCTSATAISDGWSQYSVTGAQTWACTTFGRGATPTASAPYGVQINGYAGGANNTNNDWLISPAYNLTAGYAYPLFSFWSRVAFSGPTLQLKVSTNYSGTGNPNAAGVTWTDLPVQFPTRDEWVETSNIDLSAYKGSTVYVAFVYTSSTEDGARWTLDDITLRNSTTPPPPVLATSTNSVDFSYVPVSTNATRTLNVSFGNLTGPATITSSDPAFQLSKNGTTFASSLTYTVAEVNGTTAPVIVRFTPTQPLRNYTGTLTLASAGAPTVTIALAGNTFDVANTLEVVNWNIEWFGSTTNGPTNKDLQQNNVLTILNSLKADIYAFSEVVDINRLNQVAAQLTDGPYAVKVSEFGSYADNPADPDYANAQKLAFVYKTSVFSNVVISDLFRCTQAQNCPGYNPWSSGRFPYVLDADVTLNGITKHVKLILIHAKANTAPTLTSYQRRKAASDQLKAELDANQPTSNFIILGDYNDDLNRTITADAGTTLTSYSAFTADSVNYPALTLPLSRAGLRSTVGYSSVIDNVIVSNEMNQFTIPGTTAILSSVAGLVANYGNTTTDHYPVLTRYSFDIITSTKPSFSNAKLDVYPNPVTNRITVTVPETGKNLQLHVSSVDGRQVVSTTGSLEQLNQRLNQQLSTLKSGMYLIKITGEKESYVKRFIKH